MTLPKDFAYVMIPVQGDMEECRFPAVNELGTDPFIEHLKTYFGRQGESADQDLLLKQMSVHAKKDLRSEVSPDLAAKIMLNPSLDIFPVSVPHKFNNTTAVSLYVDDKGQAKNLEFNRRAMGIVQACGYPVQEFRGDIFLGRVFDNDDDWRRVDFTLADCSSDAAWVKSTKQIREASGSAAAPTQMAATADQQQEWMQKMQLDSSKGTTKEVQWNQNLEEITLEILRSCKKEDLKVEFKQSWVKITICGDMIFEEELYGKVSVEDSTWTITDGMVMVVLMKQDEGTSWPRLTKAP